MKVKKTFNMSELLNTAGTVYFEDDNMKVSRWSGFDDWRITDLTNALVTGKTCIEYSIKSERGGHGNLDVTNFVYKYFENDLKKLFTFCSSLPYQKSYNPVREKGLEFYRSEVKSIRVFSPFNLDKVKPLKAMPKKWTLRHVYSALINGQFKDLKCNYVLTDDYAWDAACDYRKGEIKAPIEFVKKIIEHPSGWWTSYRDGEVAICCHSFDSNSFNPVI